MIRPVVILALLAITPLMSAAPSPPPPATPPRVQAYKTVGDRALRLYIFAPATVGARPATALVLFHGGGWAFGDPNEFFGVCRRYAARGLVAISVEYRLCDNTDGLNPHPRVTPVDCTEDARSALRWVRAHAAELHVDPDRIVVGGQSVGGQLALATAMLDDINAPGDDLAVSPHPAAIVLYSGTPNTVEVWCDGLLGDRRGEIWSISPAHHVRPGLPPVLAFHGTADPIVSLWKVERFQAAMQAQGNHFELRKLEGRGHYLGDEHGPYARLVDEPILEATDAWLGLLDGSRAGRDK